MSTNWRLNDCVCVYHYLVKIVFWERMWLCLKRSPCPTRVLAHHMWCVLITCDEWVHITCGCNSSFVLGLVQCYSWLTTINKWLHLSRQWNGGIIDIYIAPHYWNSYVWVPETAKGCLSVFISVISRSEAGNIVNPKHDFGKDCPWPIVRIFRCLAVMALGDKISDSSTLRQNKN